MCWRKVAQAVGIVSAQRACKAHTQVIMLAVKEMKVTERIWSQEDVNWCVILMGTIKGDLNVRGAVSCDSSSILPYLFPRVL